jgi:hypothetical protein
MRSLASILAVTLAVLPAAALACSPAPGYRVPTNLELAAQADAIVLGRVLADEGEGPDGEGRITVHPLAAYKGLTPGQDFPLQGMALATGPLAEYAERSDPLELEKPHPASYDGACVRRVFGPGATVLFFFKRDEGNWVPAGGPFSRWAEDVTGEDAPWVQLTRFYARVAGLPEEERRELLEAERDALLSNTDDPEAQAMGGDIDRQLKGPNEPLVPPRPEVAPEPDIAEGFREPDAPSAVQQALDAMRADREGR